MKFAFTVVRASRLGLARGPTNVLEVKLDEGALLPKAVGKTGEGLVVVIKSVALVEGADVEPGASITVQIEDVPYPISRLVGSTVVGE